ncbi:MAG: ornithine cyclodeaminase family protein, partial [Candidatus Hodarchaeales archaeon]
DRVIVDSISQALERGESFQAMKDGMLMNTDLTELGTVIASKELHRSSADEITVADLTGVAVQDLQISKAVFQALQ